MDRQAQVSSPQEISALIDHAVDMHTLPVVVLEAHRIMESDQASAQDIANLLTRDPALAGRILKLANSPYYGFRRRIGNLTQAIVILGFQAVKNLMLTATVIDRLTVEDGALNFTEFWAHSVATALTAGELASRTFSPHSDEAYIAGLLHDVGKLVVAQHLPDHAARIREQRDAGQGELEAEREVLGLDHTDVGHRIIASWGLPSSLAEAVRDHHSPQGDPGESTFADLVHLSDILVHALLPRCHPHPIPQAADGLQARMGYKEHELAEWIGGVVDTLTSNGEFFEILGLGTLKLRGL